MTPFAIFRLKDIGSVSAALVGLLFLWDSPVLPAELVRSFVTKYCAECHSGPDPSGEIDLSVLSESAFRGSDDQNDLSTWERVLRQLQARQMPPADSIRPLEAEYQSMTARVNELLDNYALKHPKPGSTPSVRRMNRYEYENAIRDLLDVSIRADEWLPADESSHGFDNVTVTELSPLLLNRYISAAQEISRIALGGKQKNPGGITVRLPADLSQDSHVEGLPIGTRGGGIIEHTFARDGQYELQVRLARDRDEHVEGMKESNSVDFIIDKALVQRLKIEPAKDGDHSKVDADLKVRVSISAGTHRIGVTFPKRTESLLEIRRQPFDASFNRHRHPRREPAVYEISVVGPFDSVIPGNSASRLKLFYGAPSLDTIASLEVENQHAIAKEMLQRVMHRAYRRPIVEADFKVPLSFFAQAHQTGGFEAGIESALASILVNPNFLFRIEETPTDAAPGSIHLLKDFELANRLSFFLWSSIPDDRLLELAKSGTLNQEAVLKGEVSRMLLDPKSKSLVENFADQWLYLRNLDSIRPDLRLFPDFDDNLRQAFRKETELLFECVVKENRNVLDLLSAKFTFLNERLARHYRIPNVIGSHFRRVDVEPSTHRGGLLRHGSILTVTSFATRTSPTIRGSWVLKNVLGTPPPPPPPNVPALKEKQDSSKLTVRERLAEHRSNPACASCHNLMDPLGFALDNFDAVGRWRDFEGESTIDASGSMPDGTVLRGADELETKILERGEMFVQSLLEKLLIFSLGRGVEWSDGPEIRHMVAQAKKDEFRFSALIQAIVFSKPFRMRTAK
jgi:hypothetical protein